MNKVVTCEAEINFASVIVVVAVWSMFTDSDLDSVLYGYIQSLQGVASDRGHALSGLRVEQLSYGLLTTVIF